MPRLMLCRVEEIGTILSATASDYPQNDPRLREAIAAATLTIQKWISRDLLRKDYVEVFSLPALVGQGFNLYTKGIPIVGAVTGKFSIRGNWSNTDDLASHMLTVEDAEKGKVSFGGHVDRYYRNSLRLSYTAGYLPDDEHSNDDYTYLADVPFDLQLAAASQAALLLNTWLGNRHDVNDKDKSPQSPKHLNFVAKEVAPLLAPYALTKYRGA